MNKSLARKLLLLTMLALWPWPLQADSIELVNGEILEGQILRETPDTVTIRTRFSETIMEDRPVPRKQIKSITRVRPDDLAFAALKDLRAPETALTADVYEPALRQLRDFSQRFGYSSKVPEVREKIRALEAEQRQIEAGAVKLNGRILEAEEMEEYATEINTHRRVARMNRMAQAGDLIGASNEFFNFAKENSASGAYVTAVEQARESLRSLQGVLEHEMRNQPILEESRQQQLSLASRANQASMKAARERQLEDLENSINRAKEAGVVIPPYAGFSLPSLQAAHTVVTAELAKLNEINITAMRRSLEMLGEARDFFEEREFQGSLQRVQEALEIWPDNGDAQAFLTRVEAEIERRREGDERQAQAVAEGFTSSAAEPGTESDAPTESTPE
jgi:tetratricopeptide (TPR) repeat protein